MIAAGAVLVGGLSSTAYATAGPRTNCDVTYWRMRRFLHGVRPKQLGVLSFIATISAVISLFVLSTSPAYAQVTSTAGSGQSAPFITGQVVRTFPKRGTSCALPRRISVTVSATRAQGSSYVNVRMNKSCQLIAVNSGYGTVGIPEVQGTTEILTPTGTSSPGLEADSTCSGTSGADVVDLSTDTTGAEVTQFLPFQYPCGGNTFDPGATPYASCYANQFLNYTAYDCGSVWNYEYASEAEVTGSAFVENNPWPQTFFSGNMTVQNTTDLLNWTVYANCNWDSTLSASGDTFHCAAHWS